jgi:hypothetical protein
MNIITAHVNFVSLELELFKCILYVFELRFVICRSVQPTDGRLPYCTIVFDVNLCDSWVVCLCDKGVDASYSYIEMHSIGGTEKVPFCRSV